jgi:hypothetical protein
MWGKIGVSALLIAMVVVWLAVIWFVMDGGTSFPWSR